MRRGTGLRGLGRDDGVTAIEYGLIAAGVGVASIVSLTLMGDGLQNVYAGAVSVPGLEACVTGAPCDAAPANPAFDVEPMRPGMGSSTATAEPPKWPTAPPCQAVDVGTQRVARGGTFSGNVFTLANPDVTGDPRLTEPTSVTGDALDESGKPRWTVADTGQVTWVAPTAAGRTVFFSLTYTSGTCSGKGAMSMKVANNG